MARHGTTGWGLIALIGILLALHFIIRVGYGLGELAPDFLLVAVLLGGRFIRPGSAAGLGLVLGFLEGAVLPMAMGASAVALTILGYVGGRSQDWFSDDNGVFVALYFFLGKWIYDVALYVLGGARTGVAIDLVVTSPLAAVYAALTGVVAMIAYRKFF